jgi:tetratricopeptide (TPR) repeat protein
MNLLRSILIAGFLPFSVLLSSCAKQSANSGNEESSDKEVATLNDQARNYKQEGQLEKALDNYLAVSQFSKSGAALNAQGNMLMTLGRFEEAIVPLQKACEATSYETENSFFVCDYIFCLTALKRYEEALACIDKCDRAFDQYNDFVAARAVSLMALNRDEEALLRLEQFCRDNGDPDARIYYLRALALKKLKREAESKRILNIATLIYPAVLVMKSGKRIAPITTPLYADCAEMFLKLEKPERAIQTIALANILGEQSVRTDLLKAASLSKLNISGATARAEKAIESERQFWKKLKASTQ